MFRFPPCSLAARTFITVELTQHEVDPFDRSARGAEANRAADNADQVAFAWMTSFSKPQRSGEPCGERRGSGRCHVRCGRY